ncbi:MAG TPA: hypothetical protein VLA49_17565 [Anaerolineales bacterium]|nr:hypothetical protein [Anaerolineales bacterium]
MYYTIGFSWNPKGKKVISSRLRLVIGILGLLILVCSILALAYSFWPVEILEEQFRLAPTLFSPP